MQHTEIPHILDDKKLKTKENPNPELIKGDKVIYGIIRMHMNADTRQCFPSIDTIRKHAHCSNKRVLEGIERLSEANLLKISKIKLENGKWANLYTFEKTDFDKSFERFTIDFLQQDIPLLLKEFLMDLQRRMYNCSTGVGEVSHSDFTIAEKTGWSLSEIHKFDKQLINMGIETQQLSGKIDEGGFPIQKRSFDLNAIHQAKLWVEAVNNQLVSTQSHVEEVEDTVTTLKKEFEDYKASSDKKFNILQNEYNKGQEKLDKALKVMTANGIDINVLDDNKFTF